MGRKLDVNDELLASCSFCISISTFVRKRTLTLCLWAMTDWLTDWLGNYFIYSPSSSNEPSLLIPLFMPNYDKFNVGWSHFVLISIPASLIFICLVIPAKAPRQYVWMIKYSVVRLFHIVDVVFDATEKKTKNIKKKKRKTVPQMFNCEFHSAGPFYDPHYLVIHPVAAAVLCKRKRSPTLWLSGCASIVWRMATYSQLRLSFHFILLLLIIGAPPHLFEVLWRRI